MKEIFSPIHIPKQKTKHPMKTKIKIHDGIVGAVILSSIILGLVAGTQWLYVAGGISALMVSSAFTGFCPVYFVLNKLWPATDRAE
jgi:hypothetical protein